MVIVMIVMKTVIIIIIIIIIGTEIVFCKPSPYYSLYKSSGKNKAKCYFRHSLNDQSHGAIVFKVLLQ